MKSLEERIAYRAKQRANQEKERSENQAVTKPGEGSLSSMNTGEAQKGSSGTGEQAQGASGYLNATAGDVIAKIGKDNLTDEHLAELEKVEGVGKNRVSVLNAIAQARAKLKAGSAGWGSNV